MPAPACQVNAAIERALREGALEYEEMGILVIRHLDATTRLDTDEPVLDQALYTIFRGLPARLAAGAVLFISTRDRAGGDIELVWEAREKEGAAEPASKLAPLAHGPYGDLLELAIEGLQAFCRVRSGHLDEPDPGRPPTTAFLTRAPHVRRRYFFLIPSLSRRQGWHPTG